MLSAHGPLSAGGETLELDGGEDIKTLPVLGQALEFCAGASLSRGSALIAYGGGTVGDLAGLCAALFKRGLPVIQVPTTLLAQVDASVGGKTAINLDAGKNLAGAFHQPSEVLCDTEVLATLDDAEYASGLGEVIKTAVLAGEEALTQIEASADAVALRDPGALVEAVELCVRTKAAVVAEDPLERGPRRALNLGHTFGHAIEHVAGYGAIPHGVAVAVGIDLAARAASSTFGSDGGVGERARALCPTFGLPGSLAELRARGTPSPPTSSSPASPTTRRPRSERPSSCSRAARATSPSACRSSARSSRPSSPERPTWSAPSTSHRTANSSPGRSCSTRSPARTGATSPCASSRGSPWRRGPPWPSPDSPSSSIC